MFINWRGLRSVIVSSNVDVTQGSFFFTTGAGDVVGVEVEVEDCTSPPIAASETVSAVVGRTDFLAPEVEGGGVARWRVVMEVWAVATSAFQEDFSDQGTLKRWAIESTTIIPTLWRVPGCV